MEVMARNYMILLLLSVLLTLAGIYLIYKYSHREDLSYYVGGVLLIGSMGLTHFIERYCRYKNLKVSEHRAFWPFLWLFVYIPAFFLASELNYQRNEELMKQEVFQVRAQVVDIYQSKGRSTHTWYYVYVYNVNDMNYRDKGMLEYNPVKIGQELELVVSSNDHSVHREAKFFNLTR
jgi:hypothetical protein